MTSVHATARRATAAAALAVVCAAIALPSGARAAVGDITTVAGGGSGADGNGGAATDATLREPRRVAFLSGGGFLVVEFGLPGPAGGTQYGAGWVRRVLPDGTITPFAGTGVQGFSGDDGPATDAEMNGPTALMTMPDGSVLIADEFNHRIRRVANGTITTVVGSNTAACAPQSGLAVNAELDWPRALALLPGNQGYLVLDEACGMVHRIGPGPDGILGTADDTITTTIQSGLNAPRGIAALPDGGYLIADSLNHRVRKVDAGGTIRTVAGTGVAGYNGDDIAATSAKLNVPRDVTAAPGGGFVIADSEGQRVRYVDTRGTISTIAGTGTEGVSGDGGPATKAQIAQPHGVNISPSGDLYVSGPGLASGPPTMNRVRVVAGLFPPPPPPPPLPPPPLIPPVKRPPGPGILPPPPPSTGVTRTHGHRRPLRLRLTIIEGRFGIAPRTVLVRVGANRMVTGRQVVVQIGRRVRVHGRPVMRYRNAAGAILRGRAVGLRLRITRPGSYVLRVAYRDGGRLYHASRVPLRASG